MRYLAIFLILLFLSACDFKNVRHKIGVTTKPFGKDDTFESSTKMNYTIIFGRIRKGEGKIDD